jgi:site-specific recombinase
LCIHSCEFYRALPLGIGAVLSENGAVSTEPVSTSRAAISTAPDAVAQRVAPAELVRSVEDFCSAKTVRKRIASIVGLLRWTRRTSASVADLSGLAGAIEYLESHAEVRERFQQVFAALLQEMDCVSLFAEAGIPSDHSFTSEIGHRVSSRLLPSAREQTDASKLLVVLYPNRATVQRFLDSPADLFQRLIAVLTPPGDPEFASHEYHDLQQALLLLSSRVAALGLNPEVRARSSAPSVAESPFYQVLAATEAVILAPDHEAASTALVRWRGIVHRCRTEMVQVHHHMETTGVSVELIFDLRKITACLTRMESIFDVLTANNRESSVAAVHGLLGQLMEGRLYDLSLSSLLHENLNLIARKMVERTGHSGEHYIAHDRKEYWQMWAAAIGGGLLTVITAALKLRIYDAHAPLFVEGFAAGTNYAVSFITLQIFGLVLATKQPAATAATFAGIIRENRGVERENKLTEFVSRITSTQLAAALGNVFAVSIGAVIFERLWRVLFSQSYLSAESATHVYETLNPTASGTAVYAIITGVILWMAALAGGWCENFAVYYRLTDAVAQHPLGLQVGQGQMKRYSRTLQRNLGGWSTSIVLGYLLGFTPVIGEFFGVPLDVRHVTLSTGTLALSVAHFGALSMERGWFYQAVAGIAVIFILNLFVSFSIAAYVGLRAYDVSGHEQWEILRFLILDGLKSPLRFLWPDYMRRKKSSTAAEAESGP